MFAHATRHAPYRDGYTAGCYGGFFDANGPTTQTGWPRDESLFEIREDYKEGWQEGYAQCYADERDHPLMGNVSR